MRFVVLLRRSDDALCIKAEMKNRYSGLRICLLRNFNPFHGLFLQELQAGFGTQDRFRFTLAPYGFRPGLDDKHVFWKGNILVNGPFNVHGPAVMVFDIFGSTDQRFYLIVCQAAGALHIFIHIGINHFSFIEIIHALDVLGGYGSFIYFQHDFVDNKLVRVDGTGNNGFSQPPVALDENFGNISVGGIQRKHDPGRF